MGLKSFVIFKLKVVHTQGIRFFIFPEDGHASMKSHSKSDTGEMITFIDNDNDTDKR